MGMILGKLSAETPKYELIQSTPDYEIRKYPAVVITQVTYDPTQFKGNKDGGFMLLVTVWLYVSRSKYINTSRIYIYMVRWPHLLYTLGLASSDVQGSGPPA